MHERKYKMQSLADASLALPGGFGTIEEIFEALTWAQIELHEKPCVFLNSGGYYDYLFKFLDHAVSQGLLRVKKRALVLQAPTAESALQIIQEAWAEKEKDLIQTLTGISPLKLLTWVPNAPCRHGDDGAFLESGEDVKSLFTRLVDLQ